MIATDLDRTLIAEDLELRPRTLAALHAAQAAGIRVIVATGHMVQSLRRVIAPASLGEPIVCYQGAAIFEAGTGATLRETPVRADVTREEYDTRQAELTTAGA